MNSNQMVTIDVTPDEARLIVLLRGAPNPAMEWAESFIAWVEKGHHVAQRGEECPLHGATVPCHVRHITGGASCHWRHPDKPCDDCPEPRKRLEPLD